MKHWKLFVALGILFVALSQQIWSTVQFSLPMSCSDTKESCVWYEQGISTTVQFFAMALPVVAVILLMAEVASFLPRSLMKPIPVRIVPNQRNRIRRE